MLTFVCKCFRFHRFHCKIHREIQEILAFKVPREQLGQQFALGQVINGHPHSSRRRSHHCVACRVRTVNPLIGKLPSHVIASVVGGCAVITGEKQVNDKALYVYWSVAISREPFHHYHHQSESQLPTVDFYFPE